MVTTSASCSVAGSRCTTRVGMIAPYSAISRASRRSFLASTPRARANWRSLLGLMRRTDRSAASRARMTARFVAATRLDANCGDRQATQSLDQLAVTGGVVIHRKGFPVWQHHHVETILRYVDSTVTMLCHLRAPALLMRAHALATVREWKKRLEHQAHSRSKSRGGCGLPVATGAVS